MWLHLFCSHVTYHVTLILSTSLYVGLCYYSAAMFSDFAQLLDQMNDAAMAPMEIHKNGPIAALKDAILVHGKMTK